MIQEHNSGKASAASSLAGWLLPVFLTCLIPSIAAAQADCPEEIDVVLVVDNSLSMRPELNYLRGVDPGDTGELDLLLDYLENNSRVRVALISFTRVVTVDNTLTTNFGAVKGSLDDLGGGNGCTGAEAADKALNVMLDDIDCIAQASPYPSFEVPFRQAARKVAILITDDYPGGCQCAQGGPSATASRAAAAGVKIVAVHTGDDLNVGGALMPYVTGTQGAFVRNETGQGLADQLKALPLLQLSCPDVRLDANNDGTVDVESAQGDCTAPEADDCLEDEAGLSKGLVLPVNGNDSNEDDVPDHLDTVINGSGDQQDLRDVKIRFPLGVQTGKLRLELEPLSRASHVRLYDTNGQFLLGAPAVDIEGNLLGGVVAKHTVNYASWGSDWHSLRVEGVKPGVVRVKATYISAEEEELGTDKAKINVFRAQTFIHEVYDPAGYVVSAESPGFVVVTSVDFKGENGTDRPAEAGTTVQYSVIEGSASIDPSLVQTDDDRGLMGAMVIPPSVTGSYARLESLLSSVVIDETAITQSYHERTPPVTVLPGPPSSMSVDIQAGSSAIPASGANEFNIVLSILDAAGNAVLDGTEITYRTLTRGGTDAERSDTETSDGEASAVLIASDAPGQGKLQIRAGDLTEELDINHELIDIDLVPSASSVIIELGAYVDITASLSTAGGQPIADGTKVTWAVTVGNIATEGAPPVLPVTGGTASGGQCTARLYPVPVDGNGGPRLDAAHAGECHVLLCIGASCGGTVVNFEEPVSEATPSPVRLELDQRALVGDETAPGSVPLPDGGFSRWELMSGITAALGSPAEDVPDWDLDEDGQITLVDLIRARNSNPSVVSIGYEVESNAEVFGDPGDVVEITPSVSGVVVFSGLDGQNRITLDSSGKATFTVSTTGTLSEPIVLVGLKATRVASQENQELGDDDDEDGWLVVVVQSDTYRAVAGFARGFWTGDNETWSAWSGNIVSSALLIGDVRDLLTEAYRAVHPYEEASGFVAVIAAVGVLTTFVPPADVAVTTLKAAARALSAVPGGEKVLKVVANGAWELVDAWRHGGMAAFWSKWDEWLPFIKPIASTKEIAYILAEFSDEALAAARRVMTKMGETWAGRMVKMAAVKGAFGLEIGARGVEKVIQVLDTIDQATLDLIRPWDAAKQDRLYAGIAMCAGRPTSTIFGSPIVGIVDNKPLTDMMTPETLNHLDQVIGKINPGEDASHVFLHLGELAQQGTMENMNYFMTKARDAIVTHNAGQAKGILNHIDEANALARNPNTPLVALEGANRGHLDKVAAYKNPPEFDAVTGVRWPLNDPNGQLLGSTFNEFKFTAPTQLDDGLRSQIMGHIRYLEEELRIPDPPGLPRLIPPVKLRYKARVGMWPPEAADWVRSKIPEGVQIEIEFVP